MTRSRWHYSLGLIYLPALLFLCSSCSDSQKQEFKLPPPATSSQPQAGASSTADFEVGTGWAEGEPVPATRKALEMALAGKAKKSPDFLIIYPTAGSDSKEILKEARRIVGKATRIYGGTSDARGVVTNAAYHSGVKEGYAAATAAMKGDQHHHVVAVMTIASSDITFGVSSMALSGGDSPRTMGAAAIRKAVQDAGRQAGEKPAVIFVTPSIGIEPQVLDGIRQEVGNNVVLLGGTAGGPNGAVIGNEDVFPAGVSVAVWYTDLPIGWTLETGFEKPDLHSGVVTRMDGRRIVEIDHRPSYEVYDGWLDGEVTRLRQKGEKNDALRDYLSLHPLFRKRKALDGTTYSVFSHPWAPNKDLITNGLYPTGDIKVGDRVYLSYGTWEVLLNRIGILPHNAGKTIRLDSDTTVLLGIATLCGGIMGVIPENERKKVPALMKPAMGNAPFIASITWGEQGFLPGIGYQHCNLTTSMLLVTRKVPK